MDGLTGRCPNEVPGQLNLSFALIQTVYYEIYQITIRMLDLNIMLCFIVVDFVVLLLFLFLVIGGSLLIERGKRCRLEGDAGSEPDYGSQVYGSLVCLIQIQ